MTYESLLIDAENKGLRVKEKKLKYNLKGLYKNSKILIDKSIETNVERKCILVEEIGHHETSFGNIIDDNDINNRKQELRARRWGNERLVKLKYFINAYNNGVTNKYELAEYLEVTDEFLEETINHYKKKYGTYYKLDNYLIYFEPNLGILKLI
ncbi:ImmA/IrrE family metallo-endopeptidase [Clostridium sp. CTA-5]